MGIVKATAGHTSENSHGKWYSFRGKGHNVLTR